MQPDSIGIEWMIFLAAIISFAGVLIMRGKDRFWLAPMVVWLLLFFTLVLGSMFNSQEISYLQTMQNETLTVAEITDPGTALQLEKAKVNRSHFADKLIHLLGIQSIQCLFWFLIGYKKLSLPFYRTGAISFAVFSLCYLLFLVLG